MVTVKVILMVCTGFWNITCTEAEVWTVPYTEVGTAYAECVSKGRLWLNGGPTNTIRCRQEVQ